MRRKADGLVTYHFESLAVEGLVHAVFTRLGGVSHAPFATLNVGRGVGDDQTAVAENHARVYAHLGLAAEQVVSPHQVHGNRVAVVTAADAGQEIPSTDGLVTNVPDLALLLRFADCQPILLYDPVNHALGLIHAGWRSVAQGIAHRAVETMQEAFGTGPEQLIAGLGPAIGPSCYAVGSNVASAMGYALPDWSRVMSLKEDTWVLDLPGANAQQLEAAGVRSVEQAHLCTACHSDEFYSHRAEGGRTGRFAVVAYLAPRAEQGGRRMAERHPGETGGTGPDEPDSLHPPGFPGFQEIHGDSQ
ncbi:peptidoglycan editing factor PgeF [Chloroflexota bacterium]